MEITLSSDEVDLVAEVVEGTVYDGRIRAGNITNIRSSMYFCQWLRFFQAVFPMKKRFLTQ